MRIDSPPVHRAAGSNRSSGQIRSAHGSDQDRPGIRSDHPHASAGARCRIMSNGRTPPPTHYQGGPAAAADAAFWLLRNRRPGTVLRASPLGGAGPVALLWCGCDRRCAPPLFQMYPAAALGGSPPYDPPRHPAQYAPGARGVGSMPSPPCVPYGGVGNAPGRCPGQFPTAPPLGASPGCAGLPGVRLWPVGHHARKRRPSGRRSVLTSGDQRRACCRYCPAGGRLGTVCHPGCLYGRQGRRPGVHLALDITRSGMVT